MSFTPHTVTAIYVIMALNLITQLSDGEPMGSVICRGPPLPLSRLKNRCHSLNAVRLVS